MDIGLYKKSEPHHYESQVIVQGCALTSPPDSPANLLEYEYCLAKGEKLSPPMHPPWTNFPLPFSTSWRSR